MGTTLPGFLLAAGLMFLFVGIVGGGFSVGDFKLKGIPRKTQKTLQGIGYLLITVAVVIYIAVYGFGREIPVRLF